eukprot:m51a1_g903 hypothetical protein (299) ;mRNA; r:54627-55996
MSAAPPPGPREGRPPGTPAPPRAAGPGALPEGAVAALAQACTVVGLGEAQVPRAIALLAAHRSAFAPAVLLLRYIAIRYPGTARACGVGHEEALLRAALALRGAADERGWRAVADDGRLQRTPVGLFICGAVADRLVQDQERAWELWEAAAAHGEPASIASAELGYPPAINNLGFCYERGLGVPEDKQEAFRLYKKGADVGHPGSIYNVGACLFSGNASVDPDMAAAAAAFQRASDLGDETARVSLGEMLIEGNGVEQDTRRGVELLRIPLYEEALLRRATRALVQMRTVSFDTHVLF